jgi:orotate phosphoribosyltransferase-like protein
MGRRSAPGPGSPEWDELRTKAVELRREGRTRREIGEVLGIRNMDLLNGLLRLEPVQRRRFDPETRDIARQMRTAGRTIGEIARELSVSTSSASAWTKDVAAPERSAPGPGDPEWEEVRATARALRRDGWSLGSIAEQLNLNGVRTVERMTYDIRVGRGRGRRKAVEYDEARRLRRAGWSVPDIASKLGVSRGSVSVWVRDLPRPGDTLTPDQRAAESMRRRELADARYYEPRRARKARARQECLEQAAAAVRDLSERELLLVGAALYWAEGSKSKPYRQDDRLTIINSDVGLISVVLRWLRLLGIEDDRLSFRLSIHETSDVSSAENWWRERLDRDIRFAKASLKRANPRTKRLNTGANYHGCLVIDVHGSAEVYQRVEGLWMGIVRAAAGESTP